MGIARPVPGRLAVACGWIPLQQPVQARHTSRKIGCAQARQSVVEQPLFVRIGLEGLAVDREGLRLELANTLVHRGLRVLQLALHLGQVTGQHLVLSPLLGQVTPQLLDLGIHLEQAATQLLDLRVERAQLAGQRIGILGTLLAQVQNRPPGIRVFKQARLRSRSQAGSGQRQNQGTKPGGKGRKQGHEALDEAKNDKAGSAGRRVSAVLDLGAAILLTAPLVVVVVALDRQDGALLRPVEVMSHGFVGPEEEPAIIEGIRARVVEVVGALT